MKAEFMPSRELKVLLQLVEKQYGKVPPLFSEVAFLQNKEKIFIVTRDLDKVDIRNIRINSLGLYIAEVKGEQIRLSIEGAQLIGSHATKNVCELTREQLQLWFKGEDIKVDGTYEGFVILKHGEDYVGSGKYKEGYILNFVPKARRLLEMH